VANINALHILSTTEYLFPSFGISLIMSSEKKIGYKYYHDFCVLHHNSIISYALNNWVFHPFTSYNKNATNGELAILIILVISSSNLSRIGSIPFKIWVSVSLNYANSNLMFFHSLFILLIDLSNELYLDAVSLISLISSFKSIAPFSKRVFRE
jgi:hypothetical protein